MHMLVGARLMNFSTLLLTTNPNRFSLHIMDMVHLILLLMMHVSILFQQNRMHEHTHTQNHHHKRNHKQMHKHSLMQVKLILL